MRGYLAKSILEKLAETASSMPDLIEAILSSGYGASPGKTKRSLARIKNRNSGLRGGDSEYDQKQKYYSLVYRLRKDGLITENKTRHGGKRTFSLTPAGLTKLKNLKERLAKIIVVRKYGNDDLPPSAQNKNIPVVIVAFDIPEKHRHKRYWLRATLKDMGLKMIQKSVWLGRVRIPREFISDLHQLNLINHVQIFGVNRAGSLLKII